MDSKDELINGLARRMFAFGAEAVAGVWGRMPRPVQRRLLHHWPLWAHPGQMPEQDEWRVWLLMAGRGFGKTRAGAEWVLGMARLNPALRVALVGASLAEVYQVMVHGQSGLLRVARPEEEMIWRPTAGVLTFASGAQAFCYSAEAPEKLRGPEHHIAWCDELAKWRYPDTTWDNLMLGLRLGERPQAVVTTTPRPIGLLKRLLADAATIDSRGRTSDNLHLPEAFVVEARARYAGTRLGRQELDGELIEDVEGALWTRALVERCRVESVAVQGEAGLQLQVLAGGLPARDKSARGAAMVRVVIGVDPPGTSGGDACGIVACGLGADGAAYVLGDHSLTGARPEAWARAVAQAAALHGADRVIAEGNQGGEMVEAVLRAADCTLPVRRVHASRGKVARAEPVAALFEQGKARFIGAFPELEDELCGLTISGGYEGPGGSPDRADAMVWAMTELMLRRGGAPRVRPLVDAPADGAAVRG